MTGLLEAAAQLAALPKAELHVHLEGSIQPVTVVQLAARHGVSVTEQEVIARYRYAGFQGFLATYKWVMSFLNSPEDYALITERLADELLAQNVVYAEVTISAGGILRRGRDPDAYLEAVQQAGLAARRRGLRMQWIPDVIRQFGLNPAMEVARHAVRCKPLGVVAFGMGGDELSIPAEKFREAYDFAASAGLHRVAHAGELGGPEEIRKAIEILGAERIGHGIAAMHDPALRALLRQRRIPLEVCPTSNICTGALAQQLGKTAARIEEHPLRALASEGVPLVLSTDDPPMFHTRLNDEYALGLRLGLSPSEMAQIAQSSFEHAFLSTEEKEALLATFRLKAKSLGLL